MILKLLLIAASLFLGFLFIFDIGIVVPRLRKREKKKDVILLKSKKLIQFKEKINGMLLITRSNISDKQYFELSIVLITTGAAIGTVINNILMSIVLAVGLPFVQYQLLLKKTNDMTRNHNEKLEIYMSIVTNAYIQCEDIETAIVDSYAHMDSHEAAAKPFGAFIGQAAGNANIERCIGDMKKDIDNEYFRQWCDKLALCRENASLKYVLPYVITRMRRKRTLDNETITNCHKNYQEFALISIMSAAGVLLLPSTLEIWKYIVSSTLVGKVLTASVLVVIILSTAYVVKVNNPKGDKA